MSAHGIISFDCEANGPCAPLYSMISFGAVEVTNKTNTFYRQLRPISEHYIPEALAVSGHTHAETLLFPEPEGIMNTFFQWVSEIKQRTGRAILLTDNPYFDAAYLNYYFFKYCGVNPFGHSSMSLTSMYKGFMKDNRASFRHLRTTKHTHNPLDDALGNAEAFLKIIEMGFRV